MAPGEWWKKELSAELSQGDVLPEIPFSVCKSPVTNLQYTPLKKDQIGWKEVGVPTQRRTDGRFYVLAYTKRGPAIVVSHDCEIDKDTTWVLIAPVVPLASLELQVQATVMARGKLSAFPVVGASSLEHSYADLRMISAMPRDLLREGDRIASMSDVGRDALQDHLVAFFTRTHLPQRS